MNNGVELSLTAFGRALEQMKRCATLAANHGALRMSRPRFSFCFTLDTEPDDLWANRPNLSFEHFKRLTAFHRRIVDAGARPTYLTTSEVAEDSSARGALLECMGQGDCEIGAHFHTWTREWPFPVPQLERRELHVMAHQLGEEIETAMLEYTCDSIEKAFGSRPRKS